MDDGARMAKIAETAETARAYLGKVGMDQPWREHYDRDVPYLLDRVEDLEAQVEKLKNVNAGNVRLDDRVWELEAENERLRDACQKASIYMTLSAEDQTYSREDETLDALNVALRAIHPQSE